MLLALSVLCFYIGGWFPILGNYPYELSHTDGNYIWGNGLAFRFNHSFYGIGFESRFFDSPAVSSALAGAGLMAFNWFLEPSNKD